MMTQGYLALVLHAHLPYVRHPEADTYLEEKWLYEAITECYIPLIHVFEKLVEDGVDFRITMSLTPPLISMLTDPLLQDRYLQHLESLIELAEKEMRRTLDQPEFHPVARMYYDLFKRAHHTFKNRYHQNLVRAFKRLQDLGKLEIITCAATHGFLPLMIHPEAIDAQLAVAVQTHEKHLGRKPEGIWLPECGYAPGVDEVLARHGIKYFFTDTHGVLYASPRPRYRNYAPIVSPAGVAVFGRDVESSKQVWSADEGYPGDFDYREFYRDIGYELDYDYIKPFLHDGLRCHTGMKYYRITGKTDHKLPYVPQWALDRAAQHAGNFMFNREKQIEHLAGIMDRPPLIVSPYDAELFGHWWFEGPAFLDFLIRKIHYDQKVFRLITPGEYLQQFPVNQPSAPCPSSWGYKGYNEVWLEGSNDWIYRHLHKAAERMICLANLHPQAQGLRRRALNQAAREVLLAQSSDWAFIMKTGTMVDYAKKRTCNHIGRFTRLYEDILADRIDEDWLTTLEKMDNIFPDLDYRVFRSREPERAAAGS